jgi:hypothetical protein
MAKTPDRRENQRRFAELDTASRRAIIKAVNKGRAVETRKHAPIAVGVAQRQQRFWRWSWLMGPAIALVQALVVDLMTAALNGMVATLGLVALSLWFSTRARRAEDANRALAEGRRRSGTGTEAAGGRRETSGPGGGEGGAAWWRFWDRRGASATGKAEVGGGGSGGAGGRDGATDGGGATDAGRTHTPDGRHLPRATGRLAPGSASDRPADPPPATGAGGPEASRPAEPGATATGPAATGGTEARPQRAEHGPPAPPGMRPYQPRGRKRRGKR